MENGGTWAVIPARGGSRAIPHKNLALVADRPLLSWVLDAALQAETLAGVCVTTDDDAIGALASHAGAHLHRRQPSLATATTTTEEAVVDVLERNPEIEVIVLLQATTPFTRADHIDEAVGLWRTEARGSLVSVTRQHRFRWSEAGEPLNYAPELRPRRQDWPGEFVENGALYISSRDAYLGLGYRCPPPVTIFEMPAYTAHEVDEPADVIVADALLRWTNGTSRFSSGL